MRLGLPEDADADDVRERVDEKLAHWRTLAESPLTERAAVGVCLVVIRSLDEIAADLAPAAPEPALAASDDADAGSEVAAADDALVAAPDVVLAGGPGHGLGHDAAEQRQQDEPRLPRKKKEKRLASFAERHPLH